MQENRISDLRMDEERALYHLQNTTVSRCVFAGPADGESVLKEARDITVEDCSFSLRYPLWHVRNFTVQNTKMDELTRAAIWYADHGVLQDCTLQGVKAVRECTDIRLCNCQIASTEFGWKSSGIELRDSELEAEYAFFDSRDVTLSNVHMKGKYSFQYMENLTIQNSVLDTKDAFWHSKNITVTDSVVNGEYLGWFSEGLTLIRCHISGTQPLCYCKDLRLIDCKMDGADLAFEYSDVEAEITGQVLSIKNPRSGVITVDSVGEIVREDPVMPCTGKVIIRG